MLEYLINNCIYNNFKYGTWKALSSRLHIANSSNKASLGKLLLWAAQCQQNTGVINSILAREPSTDIFNKSTGDYAIHVAIKNKRADIVLALLNYNQTLWCQANSLTGQTSLELAKFLDFNIGGLNNCNKPYLWNKLHFKSVNLEKFPNKNELLNWGNYDTLTLGDMHGNAFKLIYILTIFSIWNINCWTFHELLKRYNQLGPSGALQVGALRRFEQIIGILRPNQNNSNKKLRFIGDLFGDRGNNDYLTLLILEWLDFNKISYEIMLSNHDFNLLLAYMSGDFKNFEPFATPANSFRGLQKYLDYLNREYLEDLIKTCFIEKLKIFEVETSYQNNIAEMDFFLHAPASHYTLCQIMKDFHVDRLPCSDIKERVYWLNQNFQNALRAIYNKANDLDWMLDEDGQLFLFTWNRNLRGCFSYNYWGNYRINFIHGHLGETTPFVSTNQTCGQTYINLDTPLGKTVDNIKNELNYWLSCSQKKPMSQMFQTQNSQQNNFMSNNFCGHF